MVGMRVVARPEELVLAEERHQPGDRALVRIRRDEALPPEVVRWLLLQAHGGAERGPGEGRVGAVEEVADPARLRLEHHHAQAREALEDTELKEGGERLLHALAGEEVEVPDRPAELVEAMVDVERDRLEGRMHGQRHVEVLRRREYGVVARIAVGHACDGERTDEGAAAAVPHRALELARGLRRIAEREMRDGNQPAAGVAAEIGDPAVVRATVRTRKLGVEQLSLPEKAERGIEHGLRHPLAVEELHALLHVHGAERGAAEVRLVRRGTEAADVLRRVFPAHRAIAQFPRLVDPLAHPAERAELARAGDRRAPAVDLPELEDVVTHAYPEGPVAIGGFQVALPQIRRFKDVAVAVDQELVGRHRVLLRPRSVRWLHDTSSAREER